MTSDDATARIIAQQWANVQLMAHARGRDGKPVCGNVQRQSEPLIQRQLAMHPSVE